MTTAQKVIYYKMQVMFIILNCCLPLGHALRARVIVFIRIHLQQIAIKIFSFVYLHFRKLTHLMKGFPRYRQIRKLQSNTFS